MKKNTLSALMVLIIISLSCSSSRITSSWREPDKTIIIEKLNKIIFT